MVREFTERFGREAVAGWVRTEVDSVRARLLRDEVEGDRESLMRIVLQGIAAQARQRFSTRLGRVINATGVILHTGLGRAPLSAPAVSAIGDLARAGNVEIDLASGERRYRGHQLQPLWHELTGCESSLIVNNNAAATLLTLQALCRGREVIISRGQLIEIGGSFRLPDIFALSGAKLREVGTTNRTRIADYEQALSPDVAAIMHVHPSNYRVVGFSETPSIREITELAHRHKLIAIDDIGSGSLVDLTQFGPPAEPSFQDSLTSGADIVLGSGDKLLGGPQAGIILGRSSAIELIRRAPFARTVRVDKLTLAALAATLESYLCGRENTEIPTLMLLSASADQLRERAEAVGNALADLTELDVRIAQDVAPVGGGSLPGAECPTFVVTLAPHSMSANEFALRLRTGHPRVFPRIHETRVAIDLRSVQRDEDRELIRAVRSAAVEHCDRGPVA